MTANLVFVLNLIMAAVIVFYKKTESEIWLRTQSKVPRPQLLIWYLSMKTEGNKLRFIRFRQTQVWKDDEILEIFFPHFKVQFRLS